MKRCPALVTLAWLLTACTPQASELAGPVRWSDVNWLHPAMSGTACRAPEGDGQMRLAERGIGGTGPITRPPTAPGPTDSKPPTGVAAVITGFGSVCLAGLEVALAPSLTVTMDGLTTSEQNLAAGQRAVLVATWDGHRPITAKVAIRHEIVGPVEREVTDGIWIVAGQLVHIAPGAWVQAALTRGNWVAVSGLPQPDGGVLASRIDTAVAGEVLLRGRLQRNGQDYRIGTLVVVGGDVASLAGEMVSLRGRLVGDALAVQRAMPDQLQSDPAAAFGPGISHFAIQALISGARGGADPFAAHLALPPGTALPAVAEPAILGLVRAGATGLVATSVNVAGGESADVGGMTAPRGTAHQPPSPGGPSFGHPGGPGPGGAGPGNGTGP
ncbi:hypothetical protein ACELLULO517_14985 [Acidisoma cellulosilytica]|uniref:DUF5666 domain-containing protein n=1 Tax=Acidisoma cellulosilyticum TaxID=2802395 RepID=A0A963Z2J5_9PROT|nr:DUF5666 domain-containing protein [Acidisoma cellulosilyticum]MCB8881554.1 hypothetical protein [Acidisoma cellulosilyticum]